MKDAIWSQGCGRGCQLLNRDSSHRVDAQRRRTHRRTRSGSSSLTSVFSADGVVGLPENKAALGSSAICCDTPAGVDNGVARLPANGAELGSSAIAMMRQRALLTVSRDLSREKGRRWGCQPFAVTRQRAYFLTGCPDCCRFFFPSLPCEALGDISHL
jgi:hypothetical protein